MHETLLERACHVPAIAVACAMIAGVDEYVETLPKMRRAFMAIGLFLLAGFGGGVFIASFRVNDRLDLVEKEIATNTAHRVADELAMTDLKRAIENLTCDVGRVPRQVCQFWLLNGRPKNLQESLP